MLWLQLAGGLVLLVGGAEALVRGGVALARELGVPTLFIGLTVAAFGTSLPELAVSVHAAVKEAPGISLGNVVGSNIANILLILGTAAVTAPIDRRRPLVRDGLALALSAIMLATASSIGPLGRPTGLVLLIVFGGYLVHAIRQEGLAVGVLAVAARPARTTGRPRGLGAALGLTAAGLVGVLLGGELLVEGAVALARALGVSETIIGLTLVAVGTSLPELATSTVAALRREADIAVGNVVGSNIFNALFIMGVAALARPVPVPAQILSFDLWAMAAATALLLPFLLLGRRLGRAAGWAFILCYAAYISAQIRFAGAG
jgi:cation:H+ antiporter